MEFKEFIAVALDSLRSNRIRSILTMLGIIIGVGAVITMIALGEGAKKAVEAQIQQLGTNILFVRPGTMGGPMARAAGDPIRFTNDHLQYIREECKLIEAAIPELNNYSQVKFGSKVTFSQILGTEPDYEWLRSSPVVAGSYFTNADNQRHERVCVIGSKVHTELFGDGVEAIGEQIKIRGTNFTVVGILKEKGEGWGDPDNTVLVPILTAQKRLFGTDRVSQITMRVSSLELMDPASLEVERALRKYLRLGQDEQNNFTVRSQLDMLSTMGETSKTLGALLASIAAVSLLVGGIGIMNIMLVSVTERTREIGIRLAIGARKRDIRYQFLTEAIVISILGGIIGILAGVGGAIALSYFANWNTLIAPEAIVLSFTFSAVVGVVFGLFPAVKASNLNPIESLRYE